MLKYKLKIKDIKLEDFSVYLFALFKGILQRRKSKTLKILHPSFKKNQPGYHR